jgi:hypothetical protein
MSKRRSAAGGDTALAKTKPAKIEKKPRPRHHDRQTRVPNVFASAVAWPHEVLWPLIDRYCGNNAQRVVQAYAVLALGNARSRQQFFGESVRVVGRDRLQALEQLALRRWGRVEGVEGGDTQQLPVTIVNVFTETVRDGTVVGDGR